VNSEMQLESVIERGWRCISRPRSSNSELHLQADRVSLAMHLEAEIKLLRDARGGRNRASLEMHLEAVIERVWTCTWRL